MPTRTSACSKTMREEVSIIRRCVGTCQPTSFRMISYRYPCSFQSSEDAWGHANAKHTCASTMAFLLVSIIRRCVGTCQHADHKFWSALDYPVSIIRRCVGTCQRDVKITSHYVADVFQSSEDAWGHANYFTLSSTVSVKMFQSSEDAWGHANPLACTNCSSDITNRFQSSEDAWGHANTPAPAAISSSTRMVSIIRRCVGTCQRIMETKARQCLTSFNHPKMRGDMPTGSDRRGNSRSNGVSIIRRCVGTCQHLWNLN